MTEHDAFAPEPEEAEYRSGPRRSITGLIADLADQIHTLLRLELALFKAEAAEKLRRLGFALAALAAGVFLVFSGWIALLATAVLALATAVRPWLAALIVGLAALLLGVLLLYLGKRWLAPEALVPRRVLNSLRRNGNRAAGRRR
ncbi:MAG TPA: phage holin family protein [Stellaceae bacterium]|nr:phage holin family protein [Stellaceae bacterium]